ncbi:MAG: hypothetical protein LBG17_07235 [Bacteroidales bacterium]|jgi:hypothetical protein|nr:hypothetical protein [Bacteroidales bacterium]
MKSLLKSVIISLLIYFVFSIFCGIIKNEILLYNVNKDIQSLARISSYLSLIISGLLAVLYLFIIIAISYIGLIMLKSKPPYNIYKKSARSYISFYVLNELVKLLIFIYTMCNISNYTIDSIETIDKLSIEYGLEMKFYISDCITFAGAIFSYTYILVKKSKEVKFIDGAIIALFLIIIFIVSHFDMLNLNFIK